MIPRANADDNWMEVAFVIAKRSRCVRSQVGCVIVGREGRIVATGYNGPPAGWKPQGLMTFNDAMRCDSFCPRGADDAPVTGSYGGCVSIHAEMNALLTSDRRHREGGSLYTTRVPCLACAKAIANSGVVEVFHGPAPGGYPPEIYSEIKEGLQLMMQSRIVVLER